MELVLAIVGGLYWSLVGLAKFGLVAPLFGPTSAFSRVVYGIACLSAAALPLLVQSVR